MKVSLTNPPSPLQFCNLKIGDAFYFKNSNDCEWFCIKLNNFDGVCMDNAIRVRIHYNKDNKSVDEFSSIRIPNHIPVEKINITVEF